VLRRPTPIAIVLSSFHPGGTEYQSIELVRRLDPANWLAHVACFHREGPWLARLEGRAASIVEFPITSFKRGSTLRQMRRFSAWCRAERIEIVHACDLYANVFALPASAAAHVPVRIGSRRELNPDKSTALIALQRLAYACAHRIVANSRAAAERLRFERVSAAQLAVIPNGLDLSRFTPASGNLTDRPEPTGQTLITVANLRAEKGHDVLLQALAHLLTWWPATRLQIVGDGPERERLIARAEQLGVSDAIEFLGHREDVPALLAQADICVVPSHSEAFPNAALEAMAAGLPVVASATGGLLELVRHNRTGLLVPPSDPTQLANALNTLLSDSALRQRLGGAARVLVEANYSFGRMLTEVEALYLTELSRRRGVDTAVMAAS
jgi:glycosyltransferase involved in cell wall biosynthesis